MSSTGETIDAIIEAIEAITDIRPATPLGAEPPAWLRWDARRSAVDLAADAVEVQVIAAALPLPPLLEKVTAAVRSVLAGTEWSDTPLRLVVTELEDAAFDKEEEVT